MAPDIVMAIGLLALYVTLGMTLGLYSVLLSHAVFGTALVTAIVRARLGHMDPSLEEASRDLGASALSTFFRITIPGVLPAVIYSLGPDGAKKSDQKQREALLAGAIIGYLCKHNATLSAAEGGCQAEIGVASGMGGAAIAQAHDDPPQIAANAAGAALEHHLGMTCDPVAGFVQVPCIERCAFGAVKAWTGYLIAKNEIPVNRRVDLDSTIDALAVTAKEMNPKYKETSEGGLAVSLTLC